MINTFQIFRIIMGLLISVFVIMLFLRIADMYSALQEMRQKMEVMNVFEQAVRQTYTSGYPVTFPGFHDFGTLVYDYGPDSKGPSKLKSDAGDRTILTPFFFLPDKEQIFVERHCLDYGWWRWCWVGAVPKDTRIFFSPVENTPETRALIENVSAYFGQNELYICSGSQIVPLSQPYSRENFLEALRNTVPSAAIRECEAYVPEPHRVVIFNASSTPTGNRIVVNPTSASSGTISDETGTYTYHDASDIAVFVIGGGEALLFKNEMLREGAISAGTLMQKRSELLGQKFSEMNAMPCRECPPPYPEECGYRDFGGATHASPAYAGFSAALRDLMNSGSDYMGKLEAASQKFVELQRAGCE